MDKFRYHLLQMDDPVGFPKEVILLKVPSRLNSSILKRFLNNMPLTYFAKINSLELFSGAEDIICLFEDVILPSYCLDGDKKYYSSNLIAPSKEILTFNNFDVSLLSMCSEKFIRQMFYLWDHRSDLQFEDCTEPLIEQRTLKWLKKNYKDALKHACIKEVIT